MIDAQRKNLFLIPIIILSSFIFGCSFHDATDDEAKVYLNKTIPDIVAHWDLADLRKHADLEFAKLIAERDDKVYKSLFAQYRAKLGRLDTLQSSRKIGDQQFMLGQKEVTILSYLTLATFERGKAIIKTSIHFANGEWYVDSFSISFL